MKYKADRSIPVKVWNKYLLKYEGKYRLRRDKESIWYLAGTYGRIYPHSIVKRKLCFVAEFGSVRMKNSFLKKLDFKHQKSQEGDRDIVIVFDEVLLDLIARTLKIYVAYNLSEERRDWLTEHMLNINRERELVKA